MSETLRLIWSHDHETTIAREFPDRPCLGLIGPLTSHVDRGDVQDALANVLKLANGFEVEEAAKGLAEYIEARRADPGIPVCRHPDATDDVLGKP